MVRRLATVAPVMWNGKQLATDEATIWMVDVLKRFQQALPPYFLPQHLHIATTEEELVHTGEGKVNGHYLAAPLVVPTSLGEQLSRWLSHFHPPYMPGCSFSCNPSRSSPLRRSGDIGGLVCTVVLVAPSSPWHAGGSSSNKGLQY